MWSVLNIETFSRTKTNEEDRILPRGAPESWREAKILLEVSLSQKSESKLSEI